MARHYIKQSIDEGFIIPQYTPSLEQVADIFTKGIPGPQFQTLVSKLGMINIYTQLEGGGGWVVLDHIAIKQYDKSCKI